jgi:1,2-dihydroxy-3-keto-5-methylthiopentene dioxygenase
MAILTIPDESLTLVEPEAVTKRLADIGIVYERWSPSHPVAPNAPADEILSAYASEIDSLKARGNYVTADVIDVNAQTQGLREMLAKFSREHWHDEDEVRFIIHGRGIFHLRPRQSSVVAVEVEAGDLLCVPRGTWHWFNLCEDLEIRAIRLFQDRSGWTPLYTDSDIDRSYQPVCWSQSFIAATEGRTDVKESV